MITLVFSVSWRYHCCCCLSDCNHRLTEFSGAIESPNYPQRYNNGASCSWVIDTTDGNTLNISFAAFNLETHSSCRYDYLEVNVLYCCILIGSLCLHVFLCAWYVDSVLLVYEHVGVWWVICMAIAKATSWCIVYTWVSESLLSGIISNLNEQHGSMQRVVFVQPAGWPDVLFGHASNIKVIDVCGDAQQVYTVYHFSSLWNIRAMCNYIMAHLCPANWYSWKLCIFAWPTNDFIPLPL